MRFLYYIRVTIISLETIILLSAWALFHSQKTEISLFAQAININTDIIKYLILLPIVIYGWVIKEARDLITSEKDNIKILVNWPDYWKLKAHIHSSLAFGLFFCITSLTPWIYKPGISDGFGITLFTTSLLGNITVAGSIYFAQITIKEILNLE